MSYKDECNCYRNNSSHFRTLIRTPCVRLQTAVVEAQPGILTQIVVVLFLPLFGDHSCVVFCLGGGKRGVCVGGGTNWLARHTNFGAKRQRRHDGTKRSSEGTRQSLVLRQFGSRVIWNVPRSLAPSADTSLTSLQTHSTTPHTPPPSLKLIVEEKKVFSFKLLTPKKTVKQF